MLKVLLIIRLAGFYRTNSSLFLDHIIRGYHVLFCLLIVDFLLVIPAILLPLIFMCERISKKSVMNGKKLHSNYSEFMEFTRLMLTKITNFQQSFARAQATAYPEIPPTEFN